MKKVVVLATALLWLGGVLFIAPTIGPAYAQSTWNGGTGNWGDSTMWTGGIPDSASAIVYIDGGKTGTGSTVSLDSNRTVGQLNIDSGDALTINDGRILYLGGNSTNNGTMTLDGSLSATYLYLDNGSVTLQPGSGNTGTLTLSDNANNIIQSGNGNWTFTNGPNHTIQGAGYIGVGTMGIVNQGTITANGKNPLIIQPNGNNFVNEATGILQATNGATLQLYGSSFDNSKGGVIRAVNGSTLELNNVYITGPLTADSGSIIRNTYYSTLNNVTFTDGTAFETPDGVMTHVQGTITNNGTMTLKGDKSSTYLYLDNGSVTLQPGSGKTGTLTLSDNANNIIQSANSNWVLTNGPNHTIQGAGYIGVGTMGLVNQGTITASGVNNALTIHTSTLFNNEGTLGVLAGSTMNVTNGYTQSRGLTAVAGSLNANNIGINGGMLSGTGTVFGNVTVGPGGTVHPGDSPGVLTINGNYVNTGTLAVEILNSTDGPGKGFSQLWVNGSADLAGALQVSLFPQSVLHKDEEFDILHYTNYTGSGFAFSSPYFELKYTSTDLYLVAFQDYTGNPVPVPPSLLLLGSGLAGMVGLRLRRKLI